MEQREHIDQKEFESIILNQIFLNKEVRDRILPFLKPSIFESFENVELSKSLLDYGHKYKKFPKVNDLKLHLKDEKIFNHLTYTLNIDTSEFVTEHLLDEIGEYVRKKLVWDVIYETSRALKGDDEKSDSVISSAPDKMRDAIAFDFNTNIGLDLLSEPDRIYNSFHEKDNVIPTGIKAIDDLIRGGLHEKTLTLVLGQTNIGKSLIKCALATSCLLQNKNVLYVTHEMAEEKISERIIANLFDIKIDDLYTLPKDRFMHNFEKIKQLVNNKLVIKEYPTKTANTNHLRFLLKELWNKKKFRPDIIFNDSLNIMMPIKTSKSANTNTELKTISEELRGLAMEEKIAIFSSMQVNRGGMGAADIELTDIAESIGTTTTADIIFGVTQTDEMRAAGVYNFILLKNRYGLNRMKVYVGVDYSKMRIFDTKNPDEIEDDTASIKIFNNNHIRQKGIVDDTVVDMLSKTRDNKKFDKSKILDLDMGE